MNSFVKWLDEKKKQLDVTTDKALAAKLGLAPEVISFLYNGHRAPSALHVKRISDTLGYTDNSPEYIDLLKIVQNARLELETERNQRRRPA